MYAHNGQGSFLFNCDADDVHNNELIDQDMKIRNVDHWNVRIFIYYGYPLPPEKSRNNKLSISTLRIIFKFCYLA